PPKAGRLPRARRLDAFDGRLQRLDGDSHVVSVGVDDPLGVEADGHMALPEYQVVAPELAARDRAAEPLLQVGVARAGQATGEQRLLHQAGTVEAQALAAAPQ